MLGFALGLGTSLITALGIDNYFDSSKTEPAYSGLAATVGYIAIGAVAFWAYKKYVK